MFVSLRQGISRCLGFLEPLIAAAKASPLATVLTVFAIFSVLLVAYYPAKLFFSHSSPSASASSKFTHVVCHRGLHDRQLDRKDTSVTRDQLQLPIENTARAYHEAWSLGFELSECDITTSTDGEIFLCHDETYERVAAVGDALATQHTTALSRSEVDRIVLRDGSHPSTLLEVSQI
jgi:glycerophosphoryl diester phosphodiesterase